MKIIAFCSSFFPSPHAEKKKQNKNQEANNFHQPLPSHTKKHFHSVDTFSDPYGLLLINHQQAKMAF